MRRFENVEELQAAVGEDLGHGEWFEITQERVDLFAEATGDDQWIHVDTERAAAGPFGATIAHGYLTLSLLPKLVRDVYRLDGVKMGINYGLDRVRFTSPVAVGARVRVGCTLVSVTGTPNGFQVKMRSIVELENQDRPACVADTISLVIPA